MLEGKTDEWLEEFSRTVFILTLPTFPDEIDGHIEPLKFEAEADIHPLPLLDEWDVYFKGYLRKLFTHD